MKSNCTVVRLEDIATDLSDGLHKAPVFVKGGEYIFVNATNLESGHIVDKDQEKHTTHEEYLKYGIPLTERTILYSIDGTIGNIARYHGEKCVLGKGACYITVKNDVDVDYVYYQLQSPHFRSYISSMATGSTIRHISLKTMRNYCFPLPCFDTQKKISSILKSIDDRISTNSQINDNLLQQAQSIFSREFLSLYRIPDGWRESSLLGIADYLNGLAMQKYRPSDDEQGLPVLKIKELRQGSCDSGSEMCSPSIKPEYIVHDGDVIFSWSGSLLVDFWCGGICGLNQHLFKVTSSAYDKWFYYSWTGHHLQRFVAIAADKATTMGHIKREELAKAEVLIPSQSDYERIGGLLAPIYDLVIANRIENRKLAALRDELLPQLMSGEIDVSEVSL